MEIGFSVFSISSTFLCSPVLTSLAAILPSDFVTIFFKDGHQNQPVLNKEIEFHCTSWGRISLDPLALFIEAEAN